MKKISFYFLSTFIFLLFVELILSLFFYFSKDYSGPIVKLFSKNHKLEEEIILTNLRVNKKTNKMYPGNYLIDGVEFSINSKGFRGKEFSEKNKSNCRVISLGGSITFGLKKSYSSELEKLLKNKNQDCEALNFGIAAKGLNFIEELFFDEVINYSPNIVTLMANRNSTMYDSYGRGSVSPGIISTKKKYYLYKANKFMFSNIMTYRFIDLSLKKVIYLTSHNNTKIVNPRDSSLLHSINFFENKYFNQIANIAEACTKNDIQLVLIKEPYYLDINFQNQISKLSSKEILKRLINYQNDSYENKNNLFWIYTNAVLNKVFDDIKLKYKRVIVVDPTIKLYKQQKQINFLKDGNHLNNKGHELVADEIYKEIKGFL